MEEKPTTTLNEDVAAYGLDKVLARHGRVDLIPLVRSFFAATAPESPHLRRTSAAEGRFCFPCSQGALVHDVDEHLTTAA